MRTIRIMLLALLLAPLAWGASKASTQDLLNDMSSSDAKKRATAAEELGERGEKPAMPALINATRDKDPKVQMAVVKAISKINTQDQVHAMCESVKNTSNEAQKEAIHLLTRHYIPSPDLNSFEELFKSIGELFNPPHPIVVEPWIKVDQEPIDALLTVLEDKNSVNRIEAAGTLGILRAEPAIPKLSYYTQSPSEQMARTCVRSLGYIGNPSAGAALVPLLKHSNQEIVMDAAKVLGEFRYKDALPELQHFLDYSNKAVYKEVALQAISRIGDPSSEAVLKKYLDSDDKLMRQYAIEGFGRMGLTNYVQYMETAYLREKDQPLKLAYSFTLFSLGRKAYMDNLVRALDDKNYKDQAREYLLELGDKAVEPMAAYLKLSGKDFRMKIIRTLGDMHQAAAIPYIEPYLKDPDVDVAQAATDAVRELRKAESV